MAEMSDCQLYIANLGREDETRALVAEAQALLARADKPLGRMHRVREIVRRLAVLWQVEIDRKERANEKEGTVCTHD